MNKFTLKVNYPHVLKKDVLGKDKQIRKKRRLPIIAIGMKINANTGEKEYLTVFATPKDALKTHVEKIQKTIFFDINVIYSGLSKNLNKDFEIPADSEFRKLNINLAGCSHFILFKDNINAERAPSRGIKYEACGNNKCNETHKVIYKPNNSHLYICENCYEADKATSTKTSHKTPLTQPNKPKRPKKPKKAATQSKAPSQNKLKIAA